MIEKKKGSIRVLEAMTAFVAAKKLVRETHVAAHAANGLKIYHCFWCALKIKRRGKEENLERRKEREKTPRKPKSTRTQKNKKRDRKRENMITRRRREKPQVEQEGRERNRDGKSL